MASFLRGSKESNCVIYMDNIRLTCRAAPQVFAAGLDGNFEKKSVEKVRGHEVIIVCLAGSCLLSPL